MFEDDRIFTNEWDTDGDGQRKKTAEYFDKGIVSVKLQDNIVLHLNLSMIVLLADGIYYCCLYMRMKAEDTHTHTHTYIYIYIYIYMYRCLLEYVK
jgi:hypothetical protein